MQTLKMPDPVRAREYFQEKLDFSTGPVELDRMIKSHEDINIIDVREAEDFAKGHIPGAINLPKGKWDSSEGLSKDRINVVYCYTITCHLAAAACVELVGKGFPVMELDGGFETWRENGFDVERESVNRLFRKSTDKFLHRRH